MKRKNHPPPPVNPPWLEELDREIDKLVVAAPPIIARPFEDSCDYIEANSLTFRMFRDEFVAPSTRKPKDKLKQFTNEPGNSSKGFIPYFVPLPLNRSLFTIREMNDLFAVFTASATSECPTAAQILTYTNSLANIQQENNEFLQHIKRRWLEESWTRVNVIEEHVNQFVSLWWEVRNNRIKRYAESYSRLTPIPLTPMEVEGKLVFLETLRKYGKPTRYYTTTSMKNPPFSLKLACEELVTKEQKRLKQKNSEVNDKDKEVSVDKIAESLAVSHQAQIVATPSVLVTLLSNTPGTYEETWCIPFTIKEFNSGDQNRKIIFMDKKLPPKNLSISEKNAIYSKAALRAIFVKSKKSLAAMSSNNAAQYCSDEEYEDEEKQDEWKFNEDYDQDSANKKRIRKEISYDLWEYSAAEEHSVLSKHHRKPFKILLKTTTQGKNFDSQKKLLRCVLTSKPEYQPEYGASLMSFRDLMKEWISLELRPDSILHRVRVDPVKGTTVMVECKTPTAVANDCQRIHSRSVRHQLSIIQSLFDHLTSLPPGNYVLNHEPKDKGFMFVYRELHDKQKRTVTNLNIWEDYDKIDTSSHAEQLAPWIPIDTTVMTPTLVHLKRIPAVFPPVKLVSKEKLKKTRLEEVKKTGKKNKRKLAKKKIQARKAPKKEGEEQNKPPVDSSRELVCYEGVGVFD